MRTKLRHILGGSSGASMLFVLAVMLLLLAVGTSALAAASANAGAGVNRQISNQLDLYADSIQKSIMSGLQTSISDKGHCVTNHFTSNPPETLGGQIIAAVYGGARSFNITPSVSGIPDLSSAITNIDITISTEVDSYGTTYDVVVVTPARTEYHEVLAADGTVTTESIRYPQTAVMRGTVTVMVEVAHSGKTLKSVATYRLSNVSLEDNGNEDYMYIQNAGNWRFISHEKA